MDSSRDAPKSKAKGTEPPAMTAKDIAAKYRQEIADGKREPGSKLPAARQLAKDLRVQLLTVQSAYNQLRDEGLLLTQQGRGTFVRDPSVPLGTEPGSSPAYAALAKELSSIHDALHELGERMNRLEQTVDGMTPPSP
ncbi:GntR family transcriptional regulator [Streptomyces alboflavus]|uniref:GntR family transcriptional regulator n=1 Tax=Streptomyces alboflavus TaxID=67267 RepID=UPI001F00C279|nr:winged helix-turn-helix domain-containing protein [Streptomyces alboflavus]